MGFDNFLEHPNYVICQDIIPRNLGKTADNTLSSFREGPRLEKGT